MATYKKKQYGLPELTGINDSAITALNELIAYHSLTGDKVLTTYQKEQFLKDAHDELSLISTVFNAAILVIASLSAAVDRLEQAEQFEACANINWLGNYLGELQSKSALHV